MPTLSTLTILNPSIQIDDEDLSKLGIYAAHISDKGYVRISYKGKLEYLHRVIMDLPKDLVDHINQDKLDCRRENLRLASAQLNSLNRSARIHNKAGVIGVFFEPARNKWQAQVCIKGVRHFLGRYDTKEEAEKRYLEGRNFYLSLQPEQLHEVFK